MVKNWEEERKEIINETLRELKDERVYPEPKEKTKKEKRIDTIFLIIGIVAVTCYVCVGVKMLYKDQSEPFGLERVIKRIYNFLGNNEGMGNGTERLYKRTLR